MLSEPRCRLLSVALLLAVALQLSVAPAAAQGERSSRLRAAAAELFGSSLDALSDVLPGEDVDDMMLDFHGGGMYDLEQTLGPAVFAVPVAGNAGYVLRGQVLHDLPIVFPDAWRIVQVLIGDPTRWRHVQHGSIVMIQPGEAAARTNMTVIFANGELLQIDLEEVTGALGQVRTGRAYIGPEGWLFERIFALLPRDVGNHVVNLVRDGRIRVSDLLADPVAVLRAHTDFDALPPSDRDRWARVRGTADEVLQNFGARPRPAAADDALPPAEEPDPGPVVPVPDARMIPLPPVDSESEEAQPEILTPPLPAVPPALPPGLPPEDASPQVDFPAVSPALPPALPSFPPGVLPPPADGVVPCLPGSLDVIPPESEPVGPLALPPADGVGPQYRYLHDPDLGALLYEPPWVSGGVRLMTAAYRPDVDSLQQGPPGSASPLPRLRPPFLDLEQPDALPGRPYSDDPPRFVSHQERLRLEQELVSAHSALDFARRSAGDRIAEQTLQIDRRIADLRQTYPASVHFSLLLDPDIPPYTAPFWYLGGWHDGSYTYFRLLAPDVSFLDMSTQRVVVAERLDDYLYRLPGLVEHGAVVVEQDGGFRHLLWRRRRELEGP